MTVAASERPDDPTLARLPQAFLDDLLDRLDIVEVIDRRVKLKKAGKNYSACCPFHDEKTPVFFGEPRATVLLLLWLWGGR